jgi:hypothetical protein
MWDMQIRPHAEYFAKNQDVSGLGANVSVVGNVVENQPMRLDPSQGDTVIRLIVSKGSVLTFPPDSVLDLRVYASEADTPVTTPISLDYLGYSRNIVNSLAEQVFPEDTHISSYNVPSDVLAERPYISVFLGTSMVTGLTGSVDIVPSLISQPGRN